MKNIFLSIFILSLTSQIYAGDIEEQLESSFSKSDRFANIDRDLKKYLIMVQQGCNVVYHHFLENYKDTKKLYDLSLSEEKKKEVDLLIMDFDKTTDQIKELEKNQFRHSLK
ncbi:MAG: hypothetical protein CL678_09790 [Bdellovibrionaceae bacterium]|nr:hypothetical protein [Pseudobdellovibrionaceae bacterium]|tara:strand:- start:2140 stop:2475 length:336 start_codon:yes stop_codon:yes gene_type:complete